MSSIERWWLWWPLEFREKSRKWHSNDLELSVSCKFTRWTPLQERTLSFFWSGFVGGIPGDRLDIPLSLLHVWGEEVMKVLFSEDISPLDRCGWVPHKIEDSSHWGFQSAYYSSVTVIPPFLCAFLWCIIAQPFFLLCQWFLIFSSQTNTLSDFTSFPWMFFVPVSIQRYFCLQSLH